MFNVTPSAFINDEWVDSNDVFDVYNPATGEKILSVADASDSDINEAIRAAHDAFHVWRDALPQDRAAFLRNFADEIKRNLEPLAILLTSEQGKPLQESRNEILSGIENLIWASEEARRAYGVTIPPFRASTFPMTVPYPVGVVAIITPWNFPHSMITRSLGPALAAGCTVVIKPAEDTPLSALALAQLAKNSGCPKGVINVVPCSGHSAVAVGKILCDDKRVRKISFTGSTDVGKILMAQSAPNLKHLSLELGGNAPIIVCESADMDVAVNGIIATKFRNAGQTCISANRIFVQKEKYVALATQLSDRIKSLKVGRGDEVGVTMGPLINHQALEKVDSHVKDAISKGAKCLIGGRPHFLGRTFYEPTVLTDMAPNMLISNEETFGPVAAIFSFDTEDEAIERANDTPYGLAAYIYTKDLGQAFRFSRRIESGMISINEPFMAHSTIPFGGVKESGFGRLGGPMSLSDFQDTRYTLFGGF